MSELASAKARLRAELAAARDRLPVPARALASQIVCDRLLTVPELTGARVVVAFHPRGSEVGIGPFLEALLARGVELRLPWVEGDALHLSAVTDLATLRPGWRGILEPDRARRRMAPTSAVDAVLVPGVGFDPTGGRLGYGGGHFDRLLAALTPQPTVIAPAFALQLVAAVPTEPHDAPVDLVVTEEGVHRCSV